MFFQSKWFKEKTNSKPVDFSRRESPEVFAFIGSDPGKPEDLGAVITLQIENDTLRLTKTCSVFVPAGAAHSEPFIESISRPVLSYRWLADTDDDNPVPAVPTAPAGTYTQAVSVAEGYVPPNGKFPEFPEGFLKLLLFLDSDTLPGAPYMETMWMCDTNDTGPEAHTHEDWDELIGFLGGDPDNPDDLGATVTFMLDGETIEIKKSTVFYAPRGMIHSPILVPEYKRPFIHFTQGNSYKYIKNKKD